MNRFTWALSVDALAGIREVAARLHPARREGFGVHLRREAANERVRSRASLGVHNL